MLNAIIRGRKSPNFKAGMSRIAPALFLFGALLSALGMAEIFGGAEVAFGQSASAPASPQTVSATLDYRSPETCKLLGGKVENAGPEGTFRVCSEINRIDTFCIVDSRGAFPCPGLFKHVVECNDKYNRLAENIFLCAEKCPNGYFACGDQCGSGGEINPPGRILYVPENYRGEIFRPTADMTLGMPKFRVESSAPVMTVSAADGMTMAVSVHAAVLAEGEYSATLWADFSCAGLAQKSATVAADYYHFTITVFSSPSTLTMYFEADYGIHDGGQPSIPGIKQLSLEITNDALLSTDQGIVKASFPRPSNGSVTVVQANGYSPEFLGSLALTVRAEFYHPFSPVFGPDHCRVPDDQQKCRPSPSCRPNSDLIKSFLYGDDSLFCEALRKGANLGLIYTAVPIGMGNSTKAYPLLLAALADRVDIARTLTLNGALIHEHDDLQGGGLLNHAAFYGAPDFTRWLLEEVGENPQEKTGGFAELNPVHRLAERNIEYAGDAAAVARLLIDNGADLDASTDGWTNFSRDLYRFGIGPRAINIMTQDREGRGAPDHRSLPVLLSAGMNASHVYADSRRRRLLPLTHAAENDYVHVVSLLADAEHVNQRNPDDDATPLHYARSSVAVSLLHAGGASLNYAPDKPGSALQGWTPLDVMVRWQLTMTLGDSHPTAEHRLLGLVHLNQLGGRCNNEHNPMLDGSVLCMSLVARSPSGISALGRCGAPESRGEPGSSFYESACHLDCEAPGYESVRVGVRHCRSAADGVRWGWSRRESFRRSCESWAASASGLSCAHAEWRRTADSNADGN